MLQRWTLPWQDTAPAVARAHLVGAFEGMSGTDTAFADNSFADNAYVNDALLIVSELVTNAYRHGAEPILLSLVIEVDHLQIDVEQCARESRPVLLDAELTATGGRGLALVDAIAESWQWSEVEGRIRVSAILMRDSLG